MVGKIINLATYLAPTFVRKYGFQLFSSPRKIALTEQKIEFLNTAENIKLNMGFSEIRMYKWGSGSKIVLLCHGWQSNSFRWKDYIHNLKDKDYTIYAFDAPASGQSTGKHLNVILYKEVIEKVINHVGKVDFFVGHSLGAFSLFYTFYNDPLIKPLGFIALATPGNAMDFIEEFVERFGLNEKTYNLIVNDFEEKYKRKPDYFVTMKFAEDFNFPGLIIHDRSDKSAAYHYAEEVHSAWRNSNLITTFGLTHSLRDERVVGFVVDFMEEKYLEALKSFEKDKENFS